MRNSGAQREEGPLRGSSHFQFVVFCKRILVENVKKMGLRLRGRDGGREDVEKQNPSATESRPGSSRRGLDLKAMPY